MSFGWSAGDLIAAINLVCRIIKSVGSVHGARDHFQELRSELEGLLQALIDISDLASLPGQVPEVAALRFAACLCEDTLKRFYEKIKPFDAALAASSQLSKLKAAPRMVRWELLVKKDIPEFRSYLVAHVGSLNLRMSTATLKIASRAITDSNKDHARSLQSTEEIREQLTLQTHAICAKISSISQGDGYPGRDSLFATATTAWKAQSDMMDMFSRVLDNLPAPDLRHTWAQAPVKFEDALGRVLPIPSEYDWDKLEAIIQAQFKAGPGHSKVRSGEYELFSGLDGINAIRASNFCPVPGMSITMAFIVGQYADIQRCPRVGCNSNSFTSVNGIHGKVCNRCQAWFRKSRSSLPKPMKPLITGDMLTQSTNQTSKGLSCNITGQHNERRSYKNISIYITKLPPTPKRFRDKKCKSKATPKKPTSELEFERELTPLRPSGFQTCKCGARREKKKNLVPKNHSESPRRKKTLVPENHSYSHSARSDHFYDDYSSFALPPYPPSALPNDKSDSPPALFVRTVAFRVVRRGIQTSKRADCSVDRALEVARQERHDDGNDATTVTKEEDNATVTAEDPEPISDGQGSDSKAAAEVAREKEAAKAEKPPPFMTELLSRQWLDYLAREESRIQRGDGPTYLYPTSGG